MLMRYNAAQSFTKRTKQDVAVRRALDAPPTGLSSSHARRPPARIVRLTRARA